MTQRTVAKTVGILALLMMATLLWTGCAAALSRTNPALPPGFQDAQLPPGEVDAYLYLSQGTPIGIPTERFVKAEEIDESIKRTFVIPHVLEVSGLSLWTGSSLDSFAGAVKFPDDKTAEMVQQLMSTRRDVRRTVSWRESMTLNLVSGSGEWAGGMESSLRANQGSQFKAAVPVAWDLLHLMPEAPQGKPVAAGFVHVNDALMNFLASKAGLNVSGIGQAFGAANVSDIAFIAYADKPLTVPEQIGPSYFKEAGLGGIFVAQSTYPGFVLSFFLGSFADRVGLEKGPTIKGQEVLVKEIDGTYLMIATLGNTFFVALAPTREKAEALLTSALASHVKG
ncbi:MAG: hypothetical protein EXR53_01460 [Dehalococcoidia bacterium]|nr:hypothetical protein [Dehalococcoidia bacterium]